MGTFADAESWSYRVAGIFLATVGLYICILSLPTISGSMITYRHAEFLEIISGKLAGMAFYKVPLVSIGITLPVASMLMGSIWCILSPTPGISTLFGACGIAIAFIVKYISELNSGASVIRGKLT